jgi:drug/metabolite transporter (DMT)-like permease
MMRSTSDLSGIAAMLAATAAFVVCDTFMKLVTEDLPPFEVLFLRGIVASLSCAVLLIVLGDWRIVSGALNRRALLRAVGETLSVLCYIVALARLPIADVIAILQTAPLAVILGAAILMRERIGVVRLVLVLAGFTGAVLVAQPGPSGMSAAALLAFASAILIAARDLIGRGVPVRIPVVVVTFATNLMVMVAGAIMTISVESWVPPTGRHLAFLGFAGLFVTFGHIGILLAFRLGRPAAVAPFFYSFALWGVLSGLIIWRTLPNALALLGIALIAGTGVSIVALDQRGRAKESELSDTAV